MHFAEKCEHGTVRSQCPGPGPKTERIVPYPTCCPTKTQHTKTAALSKAHEALKLWYDLDKGPAEEFILSTELNDLDDLLSALRWEAKAQWSPLPASLHTPGASDRRCGR